MTAPFAAGTFAWMLGIEDTCVHPPTGSAMGRLDEYELTDHHVHWREDLQRVRDLGATAVRYGVRWPLVHTAPGRFDWSALDAQLEHASADLGLTVIADLVHYGTPTWLAGAFADPDYPQAVADFTAAFATRYAGLVDHLTPLNEPLTTASFCGLRGVWPPALTGWYGWARVTCSIVDGIRRSIRAARQVNPGAVVVHVEASSLYESPPPVGSDGPDASGSAGETGQGHQLSADHLHQHAQHLRAVADLPSELLLGRVGPGHRMHGWLVANGVSAQLLDSFTREVPTIDLLGVNYYPDLTPRLVSGVAGQVRQVAVNRWTQGLRDCLTHMSDLYRVPVMVTETSIEGGEELRSQWLADSAAEVARLRAAGMDVRGYTWWPLMDFVDWSWASGGIDVEEFVVAQRQPAHDGAGTAGTAGTAGAARQGQATSAQARPGSAPGRFADPAAGRQAFLRRMGLVALQEADGAFGRRPTSAAAAFAQHTQARTERTADLVAAEGV